MSESIKKSIKLTLQTINFAIKQLPTDKRTSMSYQMTQVLKKHPTKAINDQGLNKMLKQLQFNLNFIKLSNPHLDYEVKVEEQGKEEKEENVVEKDGFAYELPKDFEETIEKQRYVREEVEFSNWFDGNVDPEQLRKHKDLLKRQHFTGDYWKDKEIPQSQNKDFMEEMMRNPPPKPEKKQKVKGVDITDENMDKSDDHWEKVVR